MAIADTATLLWSKFLDSFYEAQKEELSLSSLMDFEFLRIIGSLDILMDLNGQPTELFSGTEAATFRGGLCRILYDLNKELAECRINGQRRRRRRSRKALSMNLHFNPLTERYFVRRMMMRLADIRSAISSWRGAYVDFRVLIFSEMSATDAEPSSPSPLNSFGDYDSGTVGFEGYKAEIQEKIFGQRLGRDGVRLNLIGICGMGGSGKTALVREIFDGERARSEFSRRRVWLRFSNGAGIDAARIVKEALKALDFDVDKLSDDITTSLVALLGILNGELLGKRYLIVLDNIWLVDGFLKDLGKKSLTSEEEKEEGRGEGSRGHFSQGLPEGCGGVVVVISRLEAVAREIVGEDNLVHLLPLDDLNCWKIFKDSVEEEGLVRINHPTFAKIDDEIKHQCHGLPLASKLLAKIIPRRIIETESNQFLKDFYIPDYILSVDSAVQASVYMPNCPVFVFIDTSVELLEREFLVELHRLLNRNQVFDFLEDPGDVLRRVYLTLEKLMRYADALASHVFNNLRIIVIGGDDLVNQLLAAVCDLKLPRPPPVAAIPLGSNNNIGLSLGWGKKNPQTDRHSVRSILTQVRQAREIKIDNWHILLKMRPPKQGFFDPIAPLELPQVMREFKLGSTSDELSLDDLHLYHGGLWSHFSMGMDAQVSYAAHCEKMLHPEKFKHQLVNQDVRVRCTQGWFCASLFHPFSRNICQLVRVKIMQKRSGQWQDHHIPHGIRSIICLNLPYFSGGTSSWGTPNSKKLRDRDLTPPFVDDGLMEIVGFRDAWHMFALNRHGTRLAQAQRIRFEFHKGAADHAYMSLDGKPWKQPLPMDDDTVVIEISHCGQVNMLATADCRSKSVHDPSPFWSLEDKASESSEDDYVREEMRKFGAADTFKIPGGGADVL